MTDVSMQRILLDTNVLLDYLLHRDDHAKMAEAVMELWREEQHYVVVRVIVAEGYRIPIIIGDS